MSHPSGAVTIDVSSRPARGPIVRVTAVVLALIAAAAVIELAMGRPAWCTCGDVKLWHGVVSSSENSQHVADWYTFTHVIHGLGFYALLSAAAGRTPIGVRLAIATLLEAVWEVVENTPFVIEHYRAATISLDYYGDSVLNSTADIAAMLAGFWIARTLPWRASVALAVAVETGLAWTIRDNLTLNILMLLYPIDAVRVWQMGG